MFSLWNILKADKYISVSAQDFDKYYQRGNELRDLNRLEEALANYDSALAINPNHADAHFKRGSTLQRLHRLEDGLASYDKAISINPNHADAHYNRGTILQAYGRVEDATECFCKSTELNPNDAEAYNNLGILHAGQGRFEAAVSCFTRAVDINPHNEHAFLNRGNALIALECPDEALASYREALSIDGDLEWLLGTYLHTKATLCDWTSLQNDLDHLVAAIYNMKPVASPFAILGLIDQPEIHKMCSAIYSNYEYKKNDELGPNVKYQDHEKIRIGYFSSDFRTHAVSFLIAELIEIHDRDRFEIFGFSFGPDANDEMRRRLSAAFDRFIDVKNKSDKEVAQLSRELEIDIAVDLGGYTTHSRTGIFAAGAAPVQVSYLGYIGTMGADYIDYVIADKMVIPEENQSDFTEKVVYLPYAFQVNDSKRKISERLFGKHELGLPKNGFVFCSFNNSYKISPATFYGWMRILKSVEGSVLWLLGENPTVVENLRMEAEARGVDSTRLVFAKRIEQADYLVRYRSADLFLDTLPYNAGTTASDALWAGLPVLTCMGKSFASRMAASLLKSINLSELITYSQEEYEAKAIELGTNPDRLREIKDNLQTYKNTSPLFDCKLFAKGIEAAYEAMYVRHKDGLQPCTIEIQP